MRSTIGYVVGTDGRFGQMPFYRLRLAVEQCRELDQLLSRTGGAERMTATLTASFHQPNRLRITQIEPPHYERAAAGQYVRGDVVRVQGKEGTSCGLDISARFGVPLVREQLAQASAKAKRFVEIRVPSRRRDVVEFVPDTELPPADEQAAAEASMAAIASVLPFEDFSDWEE